MTDNTKAMDELIAGDADLYDATNATPGPVEVELEPCPFCGGAGHMKFTRFELHEGHHVVCLGKKDCPLYCSEPYRAFDTPEEAIAAWNRRA